MPPHPVTLWVNVHAATMLALPILAFVFVCKTPKRRPPSKALVGWTLLCAVVTALMCMPCLCLEGPPFLQVVIPMACLWAVALFTGDRSKRIVGIFVCSIATLLLSQQYELWAHHRNWTSAPKGRSGMDRAKVNATIACIEEVLLSASDSDVTDYPAMWLSDLPAAKRALANEEISLFACPPECTWEPCWHSSLTRLYCRRTISPRDYWYLGGPLKNAKGRVVIKPRTQ